jgi:ribosomal protein S12 methylthiotransferase accessory factor
MDGGIERLVSPYGLVSHARRLPISAGDPACAVVTASVGDPGHVLDGQFGWSHDPAMGNIDGAGSDPTDPARAGFLAVAESLERYSSCAWRAERMIWATARELGGDAVDLSAWPACSAAELADPANTLVAADPDAPMRWTRGWSLTANRPVYVPAILVWLKNRPQSYAERFTHTISTGCAAHTDPAAAVVNGILEVVERDAVALTWLQRLRLPRVPVDGDSDSDSDSTPNVRTLCFDATTDLGIPVLYAVQLSDHDRALAQLVSAACELDPRRAVVKLHRELAAVRLALRSMALHGGQSYQERSISVVGGALRLGGPDQRPQFGFLLDGERPERAIDDLPGLVDAEPREALRWLLARLDRAGCEVIVVDLTTDEARQAGAVVVRVLVPQLMPVSFDRHARYLGHPRLYDAPARMGHPVLAEADVNPVPQPLA